MGRQLEETADGLKVRCEVAGCDWSCPCAECADLAADLARPEQLAPRSVDLEAQADALLDVVDAYVAVQQRAAFLERHLEACQGS